MDTARREAAACEVLRQRRHRAGDRGQGLVAPTCAGQRLHQRTGIRMLRLGKELRRRRDFDDLSGVHQSHLVGHAGHHRQVVGDQQQAHAVLALQVGQQVEDLRLNRHVERGGRLVGDQVVGLAGQRHRDHHALFLAAAHAERVVVDPPFGLGDADSLEPVDRLGARSVTAQRGVGLDRLDHLPADREHRVQAGAGLLEDHADAPAAHRPHA